MQNHWNLYTLLVRMQNDAVTLGNGLAVSNKVEHILTL